MPVEQFTVEHRLWTAHVAHLERANCAKWVLDETGQPRVNVFFLAMVESEDVAGHISLKLQEIVSPATEWSEGKATPIVGPNGIVLRETFVQTFAVDEAHRRRGYGLMLQREALALTRELGCYQMRSWSSVGKTANYALKLSMGFAVHPAIQEVAGGQKISGVYFVKTV